MTKSRLKSFREEQLLTKAELARKAGISTLTIDRIEAGLPCRMDTKRKIIFALGLKVSEKNKIFGGEATRPASSDRVPTPQLRGSRNGAR